MSHAGLSVGIMSASQGHYSATQFLLDMGQGARVATSAYPSPEPPPLSLRPAGSQGLVEGWSRARARAAAAPQELTPGLLASQIPGGAGYVSDTPAPALDGILAADRSGRVSELSLGAPASVVARTQALLSRHRLVVADLPAGAAGIADLRELERSRPASGLLIALQRVAGPGGELLWAGTGGLSLRPRELTSKSTQQAGLIVSVDVAPTVLGWLELPVPAEVRGQPIETSKRLDAQQLGSLMSRLHVVGGRRLPALGILLCAWLALLLLCAPWARARAWAMRTGAVGVLWAPGAVMITAAIAPSAPVEYLAIALLCIALGALSDLLTWPRALIAPALIIPLAITVDALSHSQLLMRSVMGPNPLLGARFYGVGNELKSGLAVLVLAAVAAALHPGERGRRAQAWMIAAGVLLAVIEGSAGSVPASGA